MKIYYTDCFVIGSRNPSDIGGGYTITNEHGTVIEQSTIYKKGFTNNEGEILGVIRCIDIADSNSEIYTDSKVACAWIRDGKTKARKDLTEILGNAKRKLEEKKLKLIWIGRDENLAGIYNENTRNS